MKNGHRLLHVFAMIVSASPVIVKYDEYFSRSSTLSLHDEQADSNFSLTFDNNIVVFAVAVSRRVAARRKVDLPEKG